MARINVDLFEFEVGRGEEAFLGGREGHGEGKGSRRWGDQPHQTERSGEGAVGRSGGRAGAT